MSWMIHRAWRDVKRNIRILWIIRMSNRHIFSMSETTYFFPFPTVDDEMLLAHAFCHRDESDSQSNISEGPGGLFLHMVLKSRFPDCPMTVTPRVFREDKVCGLRTQGRRGDNGGYLRILVTCFVLNMDLVPRCLFMFSFYRCVLRGPTLWATPLCFLAWDVLVSACFTSVSLALVGRTHGSSAHSQLTFRFGSLSNYVSVRLNMKH